MIGPRGRGTDEPIELAPSGAALGVVVAADDVSTTFGGLFEGAGSAPVGAVTGVPELAHAAPPTIDSTAAPRVRFVSLSSDLRCIRA
jgi:hypothetical protein